MVWYEAEVRQLEDKFRTLPSATDRVVFYGSSSMRLWTTLAQDFSEVNTLNLGFGGSTLAACAWFFERLLVPAAPQSVILYAGDNDLGDGRHSEEVYLFFCAFIEKMEMYLPDVPLTFLSIKISPVRWNIADKIRLANELIKQEVQKNPDFQYVDMTTPLLGSNGQPRQELFEKDGLHLNPQGYRVWQQTIQQAQIFNNLLIPQPL
ncbi:SGNH/GDSL hydrolase family protein [Spirosoma validum]|uniref:GDSL family lipase n=1 Tax=Spirosoma validum TaxID=2771355 RepID=A0A927B7G1_9BACT|nr:SGNH/GDSL hydrolase family protein [Spirosoma validum]MBD2756855.1 GDSL family lipase [Spirosoma validum]